MTILIRGQLQLTQKLNGCVLTLGNFDGIHLGHQQLLQALKLEAKRLQLPSAVLTFEPSPQLYFSHQRHFPRLMYFREKWLTLQENQIDYVICLRFKEKLAALPANDFVHNILIKQLGVKSLIIGEDFRFGAKRLGDVDLLRQLGKQYSFTVREQPSFKVDDERISSTQIRQVLEKGDIVKATRLLGHPYFLCGKVMRGDQRGQILGFPTANIDLRSKPVPLSGIFVVEVLNLKKEPLPGVASLGVRPMFDGINCWLEVHLLDFSEKIYGKQLRVNFLSKLRDESHFVSVDALVQQMHQDVENTRLFFKTQN